MMTAYYHFYDNFCILSECPGGRLSLSHDVASNRGGGGGVVRSGEGRINGSIMELHQQ